MSLESTIGGNGALFVGEDKLIILELLAARTDGLPHSVSSVPVDMTGWIMVFDVRVKDTSGTAIVSVTPITIVGTYNASRASNTQRGRVALTDDQLNLFQEKNYRWSWKRTDAGSETVLGWGDFNPQKATAP